MVSKMIREDFYNWIKNNIVYLDGATGSNLLRAGMPQGVCPEKWILDNPEVLIKLQQEYVGAGSNIVYAPTFACNRVKLSEYGLADKIGEMNRELVALSKKATGDKALVAGDITMTGRQLYPMGTMQFEELVDIYKEQIAYIAEAGADLIVVETMLSLQETRAAVIAAKEICDLPVIATLSFGENGKTLFGTDAKSAAITLEGLGVSAMGINCSCGPDQLEDVIRAMRSVVRIPIIAKPNAGLPGLDGQGNTVYSMGPEEFAEYMEKLVYAGATVVGGCCGTSPEYIAMLSKRLANADVADIMKNTVPNSKKGHYYICSERNTLEFTTDDKFLVIGERINPTGKKKLQAELKEGSVDMVLDMAMEQQESGASILDVNMGMGGIDEKEMMLKVIGELTQAVDLPLCIDSSHVDVVEAALRIYPGRALINSISLEDGKPESLLPLAKKYGAMFILLPLSSKGLPESLEEKHGIIRELVSKAKEYGLIENDIIVDGLVTTVGANPKAALETLETIRYCKEELELATVVGLSNISFGLPDRIAVNTAFLTMAIQRGLTMAIANPMQDMLMKAAFASDMLLNREGADVRYIEAADRFAKRAAMQTETTPVITAKETLTGKSEQKPNVQADDKPVLYTDVLKGNKSGVVAHAKQLLKDGISPDDMLNSMLVPAINEVGALFEKQIYFLPQLINAAETMKLAIEQIEPLLEGQNSKETKATVVMATVQGDIHDIGKNLVVLMLKNYGYRVIDLGKDVSCETIIETAVRESAQVIGLSALMTTTMTEMKKVVDAVREAGCSAKIMVGGAVVTDSYAKEIGADGYAKDAASAVKVVEGLIG